MDTLLTLLRTTAEIIGYLTILYFAIAGYLIWRRNNS